MNNIYVDELPKSCGDCVCFNKVNGRCQLKHLYIDTDLEPIDCQLKPLSYRLAEERKKVVQEIREKVETKKGTSHNRWVIDYYTMTEILDKVERGE